MTWFTVTAEDDNGALFVARVVAFFTIFILCFHALGFWDLIVQSHSVSVPAAILVLALMTGGSLVWLRRTDGSQVCHPAPSRIVTTPLGAIAKSTLTLVVGIFLVLGMLLVLGFARGWEVHGYHMPIAVHIFQAGTLQLWDQSYWAHFLPANMSIVAGFFLHFLPERIIAALNLPFLALAAALVYLFARLAGADRDAAVLAAIGFSTVPMLTMSAIEVGADIVGAAFGGAAAYLALVRPKLRPPAPLLAGAAAGLAFGFKSLHLVTIAGVGLVVVIAALRAGSRMPGAARWQLVGREAALYATAALVTSAFWLVRNGMETGNPLYPVHFSPWFDYLGWPAAPDMDFDDKEHEQLKYVDATWQWIFYPWVDGQKFSHGGGLGAFFAATVPIAWLLGGFACARVLLAKLRSGRMADRLSTQWFRTLEALWICAGLFALGTYVIAVWWLLGDRIPRYAALALVLLMPLVAWMITLVSGRLRRTYEVLLASLAVIMALVPLTRLVAETGFRIVHSGTLLAPRSDLMLYPAALDQLPGDAVILNGGLRIDNYMLSGAGQQLKVVSATATRKIGASAPNEPSWRLDRLTIDTTHATHLFVRGSLEVSIGPEVCMREVDRLEVNPFNDRAIEPRILYEIQRCDEASGADR